MDDKVVYQEIVPDNPFPGEPEPIALVGQSNPVGTVTQTVSKEKTFPVKILAHELLSTAINTRSRKVLQEFTLQQSGGFKIGDFKEGLSGEVSITPNGLLAKNISGITTIVIDGDTGDAIFAGELRTGALITGTVEITDGNIALYNNGVLEIFIGDDGT